MEYAILREAALMCRDFIIFTPPFVAGGGGGDTKEAEKVGKAAVERDIRKIFVPKNDKARINGLMMIKQLGTAAKQGDFASFVLAKKQLSTSSIRLDSLIGNKIVNDNDDTRAYRKAQSFFNKTIPGRINPPAENMKAIHDQYLHYNRGGRFKFDKSKLDFTGRYFVNSKGELNAYIKKRQEEVGRLKSGWWNVIEALPKPKKKGVEQRFGQRKVAAYVKKFPGNNMQSFATTKDRVSLLIGNQIGNNDDVASRNNVMGLVYANAVARIERDLEQFVNRDNQKFNNGEIR
jgi:hypothetical protein